MNILNEMMKFVIIILLLSSTLQSKCKIHDLFITLGDNFSSKRDSSSYWVISVTIKSQDEDCEPRVNLLNTGPNGEYEGVQIQPFEDVEYYNKKKDYKRINYRFKLTKSQSSPFRTWSLSTTQHSSGPYLFPSQGRSNPKDTAQIVIVADFDISKCSQPFIDRLPLLDRNKYDFLMHVGDFAYDVDDNQGQVGDDFFKEMSDNFATEIPYIITAGNHETYDSGRMFDYRFKMPGSGKFYQQGNHYFSFDYKGVHYLTIDWDYVFNIKSTSRMNILNWLKNDLESTKNNPDINFKVFFSHRPTYCPRIDEDKCKIFYHLRPFDIIMQKYGVDVYFTGHCHQYFRLKRQSNFIIPSGEKAKLDPLRIVNGVAGCDKGKNSKGEWIKYSNKLGADYAPHMTDFMYTDSDSAYIELITTSTKISGRLLRSKDNRVLDSFEILKADRSKHQNQQSFSDVGFMY